MTTYTLPIPPSVNAMYRTHGHITYKTKEAKDWTKECLKLIKVRKTLQGRVDVSVALFLKRDRDVDNSLKALLDLLEDAKVIENDRQVYSILVTKAFDKENPHVEVSVVEND